MCNEQDIHYTGDINSDKYHLVLLKIKFLQEQKIPAGIETLGDVLLRKISLLSYCNACFLSFREKILPKQCKYCLFLECCAQKYWFLLQILAS